MPKGSSYSRSGGVGREMGGMFEDKKGHGLSLWLIHVDVLVENTIQ